MFDLYAITPEHSPEVIERGVERMLSVDEPERIAVLLRAKHLPRAELRALGRALRELTKGRGARLLVSADLELCAELVADGVQLPERGPSIAQARAALDSGAWIGASRHDASGLAAAARDGATFATLSPVYDSPGKGRPLGEPAFAALTSAVALPVVALGGIETGHVAALIEAGAAAIAVIRAVFEHRDPAFAARAFLTQIDRARAAQAPKASAPGL